MTYPEDISYVANEKLKRWLYKDYNFWSPFPVRSPRPGRRFRLRDHLRRSLVLPAVHLLPRRPNPGLPLLPVAKCHRPHNVPQLQVGLPDGIQSHKSTRPVQRRHIFKNICPIPLWKWVVERRWELPKDQAFRREEIRMEGVSLDMYMIQLEFKKQGKIGRKGMLLRSCTYPSLRTRPFGCMVPHRLCCWDQTAIQVDMGIGHMRMPHSTMIPCIGAPIDVWNDFLLEMIKTEKIGSHHGGGKTYTSGRTLG